MRVENWSEKTFSLVDFSRALLHAMSYVLRSTGKRRSILDAQLPDPFSLVQLAVDSFINFLSVQSATGGS